MGKQPDKKPASSPDKLFVFGVDDDGKPRGARFSEFNEKVVSAAGQMELTSVHPASAAFTELAMKLPIGRLYASGKAFVPPIRRDLLGKLKAALEGQSVELEIVKRTDQEGGFKVVRRRWVIERTLSWLRRNRRLMAHYEAFAVIAEGFAKLAMICVMLKRLTEPKPTSAT